MNNTTTVLQNKILEEGNQIFRYEAFMNEFYGRMPCNEFNPSPAKKYAGMGAGLSPKTYEGSREKNLLNILNLYRGEPEH